MGALGARALSRSLLSYSKQCQNAPKHFIFTYTKIENFLGRGHSPSPRPPFSGGEKTPLRTSHPKCPLLHPDSDYATKNNSHDE